MDGCVRPHYAHTWCRLHYMRWYRHGEVRGADPERLRQGSLYERVLANLGAPTDGGCREFTWRRDRDGYGRIGDALAHRVVWAHHHGPIPPGLSVLHTCDNPPCCEIDHLWLGTPLDNTRDMIAKGRGAWQ